MKARTRRLVARPARALAQQVVGARTGGWAPASRLLAVGEGGGWSVDEDARHLEAAARRLGYEVAPAHWARFAERQAVFLTSHFEALTPRWLDSSHRLGVAYLHGRPGTPGVPGFDVAYETLRQHADRFWRVRVTHTEMRELVIGSGVPPERVFQIPLGIDLEHFPLVSPALRKEARAALGLPASALVVGSFQKDGVGWADGLEPKLIKGPDVFVAAVAQVRCEVPELTVLLTGPARGYVRRELERLGIPYRHVLCHSREEIARAYRALDVYLVASRQEGGPKAVLEAMASGVPVASTRVGQAQDLVEDGVNGYLVDVEDAEALAAAAVRAQDRPDLTLAGRRTAERFALEELDPKWAGLLDGFVEREQAR